MHLVVLAFIGVRSCKHTIYCATKLALPYVFFFVFRIARSRTVWVTVIFKAWFWNVSHIVFFIACEIYFLLVLSKCSIRSKERASWTWLRHQSGNKHPTSFPGSLFSASLGRWNNDQGRQRRETLGTRLINTVLKKAVFGKSCWNVDTWKMLLSVLKRYFFGFIEALPSKGY